MGSKTGLNVAISLFCVALVIFAIKKITEFSKRFSAETQRIASNMRRADNYNNYSYWRKEMYCHYICLIPFITEKTANRLYGHLFYKPMHKKERERSDGIFHVLAPSVIGIFICTACLCGASWAWFSAASTTSTAAIQAPQYTLGVDVRQEGATENLVGVAGTDGKTTYSLQAGKTYVITLNADGTENATGYCKLEANGKAYYTEQIKAVGTFKLVVRAEGDTVISLTTKWGTCAVAAADNTVKNGDEITASGTTKSTPPTAEVPVTNENMPFPSIPEQATGENNANNAAIPETTQAQSAVSETERQNSVTETATQTEIGTNEQE